LRVRIHLAGSAFVALLLLGTASLIASIYYGSSILAFIGLGLVFWGGILLYIKPEEYARKTVLEAALSPALTTLNQMIQELGYRGDAIYLPPKYFTDPETTKVYVSKQKLASLPTPEQTQEHENQPIARTPQGLLLTPPGIQLSKLLEKSLGRSFLRTDLRTLKQTLPELFIEKLEIAESLEIQAENDATERKEDEPEPIPETNTTTIRARINKPVYGASFKETEGLSQPTASISCPICSAIAIALTKASGKLVRIADFKSSEDGKTIEAIYEMMEK
jgi:hypothetical protein